VQHVREELLENIASKIELRKEEEARVYCYRGWRYGFGAGLSLTTRQVPYSRLSIHLWGFVGLKEARGGADFCYVYFLPA
jgi:hypothetical protein